MTIDDVRTFASTPPRSSEALVRGRVGVLRARARAEEYRAPRAGGSPGG